MIIKIFINISILVFVVNLICMIYLSDYIALEGILIMFSFFWDNTKAQLGIRTSC